MNNIVTKMCSLDQQQLYRHVLVGQKAESTGDFLKKFRAPPGLSKVSKSVGGQGIAKCQHKETNTLNVVFLKLNLHKTSFCTLIHLVKPKT